ncbi:MAG TPA: YciI family protein [Puia sp.]|nr:YciI family protein [Puia sp.]
MEKFLLLVREDINMLKQIGIKGRYDNMREMLNWVESLAESGNFTGGEPLVMAGKYVNHHDVLSDGPFIETKEAISGYIFLQAENIEQAAAIAQTCPLVMQNRMILEVRPIMVVDKTLLDNLGAV